MYNEINKTIWTTESYFQYLGKMELKATSGLKQADFRHTFVFVGTL